jgi:hypothetical protein
MTKRILITLGLLLVAVLASQVVYKGGVSKGHNLKKQAAPQSAAATQKQVTPKQQPPAKSQVVPASFRPLNMALIRGGFTSAEQFYQRVQADPVLRSFYGSCADPQATLKPLAEDVLVFSTFRRGDTITWARKPLLVHQGEYVFTFCGKTVLARCGNLVSWSPMQPSEDVPPSLLEVPTDVIDPPVQLAESRGEIGPLATALAPTPGVSAVAHQRFWFIPPIYVPSGGSSHSAAAPAAVSLISGDEFDGHQGLFTLLAGLLAIALIKLATR